MRYICFIAVLFWFNTTNAKGYISYHQEIIKAENHIQTGEYNTALILYNKTFNEYPHAFYKDLHNACVCACKTGQLKKASQYAEKLVLHGYEITDFNNSGFAPLRNDEKLWKKFEKKYPLLRQQYNNSLNHELRTKYSDLLLSDQIAATSRNSSHSSDSVFYHQAIELSELFQKNGFPVLDANKDSLRIKVFVMLRHYFGLVNRFQRVEEMQRDSFYTAMNFTATKLDSIVLAALHTGKILPQTYADATSYHVGNPYGNIAIKIDFETEEVGLYLHLNPNEIVEVNKKRTAIGLFPIDNISDDIIKTSWYAQYPFKEVKETLLNCESCQSSLDYMNTKDKIENAFQNAFEEKNNESFILNNADDIKEIWFYGIHPYMANQK